MYSLRNTQEHRADLSFVSLDDCSSGLSVHKYKCLPPKNVSNCMPVSFCDFKPATV
ncbi:hypothetical protein PILCRDRAFT_816519 [Piloderma croceum F 1598]|uniref:Uncharacterized protein n=1 Tax=Piloderma croceum (strain F 1598) TaxID=765440 RepID=A0A0C3BI28_PILCF|nr:hypothetical protein PILCRDRAFT_816519 [Piloderma croceum F 1598]